ncbi:DUF7556 family protein [Natronorarus salvus]|uniref:DUF7556 family protein n=1 Tax=Natronorarus salvus TaxID=3117733 RepID=UPI002F26D4E3
MSTRATRLPDVARESEVMAAVDEGERCSRYVIADVSIDDAWLSMPVAEAASLRDWR